MYKRRATFYFNPIFKILFKDVYFVFGFVFRVGSTIAGLTTVTLYSVAGLLMSPVARVSTWIQMASGRPQSVRRS